MQLIEYQQHNIYQPIELPLRKDKTRHRQKIYNKYRLLYTF